LVFLYRIVFLQDSGVAASARVGNCIGARSAAGAKYAAHASALLSVIIGSVVMIVMMATKDVEISFSFIYETYQHVIQVYGYLFTDDIAVVKLVSKVMPLVASFQVADGLAGSCGGVLRGQGISRELSCSSLTQVLCLSGRQHLGALFNIIAYYVLALPLGITLAFKARLGLQGLWIGE
jgi:multidrug resistance protein, MATE family